MGIPLVDLRQDRDNYYLQLGYSPDFYATLAQFEQVVPRTERRYIPELAMWRVSKRASGRLPEFFPNFEALAHQPAKPVRAWWKYIPVSGTVRIAVYAVVLFLLFSAWRSGSMASTARTVMDRLPDPIGRLLNNPTALARGTESATKPAATLTPTSEALAALTRATCRGQGTPLGMVYVNAPTANIHQAPDGSSPAFGEITKGKALCVYKNEGDWQGGTIEGRTETVWVYKPLLSTTPPK